MEIRLAYSKKKVCGINGKTPSCLIEVNISTPVVLRDLLAKLYHLFSLLAEAKLNLVG